MPRKLFITAALIRRSIEVSRKVWEMDRHEPALSQEESELMEASKNLYIALSVGVSTNARLRYRKFVDALSTLTGKKIPTYAPKTADDEKKDWCPQLTCGVHKISKKVVIVLGHEGGTMTLSPLGEGAGMHYDNHELKVEVKDIEPFKDARRIRRLLKEGMFFEDHSCERTTNVYLACGFMGIVDGSDEKSKLSMPAIAVSSDRFGNDVDEEGEGGDEG